jgi:hypothetical protein
MKNKTTPTEKKEYSLDDYNTLETIKEAKDYLHENFKDGCECPCCGQFVRLYKRNIYKSQLEMLFGLYKLSNEYHHMSAIGESAGLTYTAGGIGLSKLAYWGLILEKPNINNRKKRTSGYWQITQKGRAFIEGKITIPKYVLIYNAKKQGFSGDDISISDIIDDFDYEKLMKEL